MRNNRISYKNYAGRIPNDPYVEDAVFDSLADVAKVLDKIEEKIKKDGFCSAESYYKLIGGSSVKEDSKYGWTDVLYANVMKTKLGYKLQMPRTVALNDDAISKAYDLLCNIDRDDVTEEVAEAIDCLARVL